MPLYVKTIKPCEAFFVFSIAVSIACACFGLARLLAPDQEKYALIGPRRRHKFGTGRHRFLHCLQSELQYLLFGGFDGLWVF